VCELSAIQKLSRNGLLGSPLEFCNDLGFELFELIASNSHHGFVRFGCTPSAAADCAQAYGSEVGNLFSPIPGLPRHAGAGNQNPGSPWAIDLPSHLHPITRKNQEPRALGALQYRSLNDGLNQCDKQCSDERETLRLAADVLSVDATVSEPRYARVQAPLTPSGAKPIPRLLGTPAAAHLLPA